MNQCICIKQLLFNSWYKVLASFCWPPYQVDRFIYSSTGERVQGSRCPQMKGKFVTWGKHAEIRGFKYCCRNSAPCRHLTYTYRRFSLATGSWGPTDSNFSDPYSFFLGILTELWGMVLLSVFNYHTSEMCPMSPPEEILDLHSNQLEVLVWKGMVYGRSPFLRKDTLKISESQRQRQYTQISDLVKKGKQHLKHVPIEINISSFFKVLLRY